MTTQTTTTKGHLGSDCANCGHRHFGWSHTNASCNRQLRDLAWQHSAAGIRELAAQAREDGNRHFGKARRQDGTISQYRLEAARFAFAQAAEIEGITSEQAGLVARMGAGAQRLRAAALARRAA